MKQFVEVMKTEDDKWVGAKEKSFQMALEAQAWLSKRVDGMLQKGQLLVFVSTIACAEESGATWSSSVFLFRISQNFKDFLGKRTEFIHGDLDQGTFRSCAPGFPTFFKRCSSRFQLPELDLAGVCVQAAAY